MKPLGVGLIGANPDRGWAISSHLPALLDGGADADVRLVAAGTSRPETAKRAEEKFGVPGYADYRDLIRDPAVDIVTVSVKLPLHHQIVSAALDAGKHVYCEWPLARTLDEAEDLAARAKAAGSHSMIGLQSRASPALDRLASLIRDGYVGDILGVSVVASGFGWGGAIDAGNAYLFDAANGATLLTITGGHLLDAVVRACGEIEAVSAYLPTRRSRVAVLPPAELARYRTFEAVVAFPEAGEAPAASADVINAAESFRPTSPDQVAITARLAGGAPLSVHIRGGLQRSTGLMIEVIGTEGELRLTGPAGVIQMVPLALSGARGATRTLEPIAVAEDPRDALGPISANLARLYAAFARDIREGTRTVADFGLAARHQRLMEAIQSAGASGRWTAAA
ncbi:gfo/Idh/MocA family oxidoreductase [Sphingomonas histidinilytica]|uniref:Predicted dehydrogenase n=1 Tax=Rhizorhabdus histidinilytica TaxID=439228 RepID=A0A1T5GBS9_9SPHN|nr:Gfo/Idh/MocA family oxidoreductase [Rhizorhabdus histidinilytica]MBO9379853.1 gfo/Idh/MocA family oxidoreductase [Rhizorhabdus histidinilytica]SKC05923.1 Predicted dehydrogenase [Rhizorhabdus histidinilytica]